VAFVVLIGRVTMESSLDHFAELLSVDEIVPVSSPVSSDTILSETAMIALARSKIVTGRQVHTVTIGPQGHIVADCPFPQGSNRQLISRNRIQNYILYVLKMVCIEATPSRDVSGCQGN
jgi:hypothetical protein